MAAKTVVVKRFFRAPVDEVWRAWTESELLDKWWAPKPWRAETKSHDFSEGGTWLYSMVGPEGERHYARVDYTHINPHQSFEAQDAFCDEEGVKNDSMPSMQWRNSFKPSGEGTEVTVVIKFPSAEAMEELFKMGFQEGFAAAHTNLDELLQK